MKMYTPVLIESAEQADTLPEGTVVIEVDEKTGTHNWAFTSEAWSPDDLNVFPTEYHIALVPIEAKEEWTVGHESPSWAPGTEEWAREFQTHVPGRRLFRRSTTPWEEA